MENLFEKIIIGAVIDILLYVCWYILPSLKEKFVKKGENDLEKHGLLNHYKTFYKILKTFLYILLIAMIIFPILFFLMVMFAKP